MWSTTSDSTYLLAHLTEPPLLASKLKGITKCPALVFIRHLSKGASQIFWKAERR